MRADRIDLHRLRRRDIGDAEGALIDDALAIGRHGDDAGDILAGDAGLQGLINDRRWLGLLGIGGEWQCSRAADERNEFAPFHWIVPPLRCRKHNLADIAGTISLRRPAPKNRRWDPAHIRHSEAIRPPALPCPAEVCFLSNFWRNGATQKCLIPSLVVAQAILGIRQGATVREMCDVA
jgi:hypothetical protein